MRAIVAICLTAILFVTGCANRGTIVRKQLQPLPFSYSLGIEAIYRFDLRDRTGRVRHQMVTEAVFAQYKVGDYFDERHLPPPIRRSAAPDPRFVPMAPRSPLQSHGTSYRN